MKRFFFTLSATVLSLAFVYAEMIFAAEPQDRGSPDLMPCILVTGANGLVGSALCEKLVERGYPVRAAFRNVLSVPENFPDVSRVMVGDLSGDTDWSAALEDIDIVVHLAAKVPGSGGVDALDESLVVNVQATEAIAVQSYQAGVKRFLFMSSIKVHGEGDPCPYSEESLCEPIGTYAISKWEGEKSLLKVSNELGLEVVILRPPVVYGPGVKANFNLLMSWVSWGIPFPFGSNENKRSMIYLGNLVDAVLVSISSPSAAGKTYVLSDGEDLSLPEWVTRLAAAMDRPARVLSVPGLASVIRLFGSLTGKSEFVHRLLCPPRVNFSLIEKELGWEPPYSVDEGISETVKAFLQNDSNVQDQ